MPRSRRLCFPGLGGDWFGGKSSTKIATLWIRLRNSSGSESKVCSATSMKSSRFIVRQVHKRHAGAAWPPPSSSSSPPASSLTLPLLPVPAPARPVLPAEGPRLLASDRNRRVRGMARTFCSCPHGTLCPMAKAASGGRYGVPTDGPGTGEAEHGAMKDLRNRIALVTGGSRGIGAAVAVALANAGADVAVNYRDRAQAANAVCGEIAGMGRKSVAVQADVSVVADVKRLVAETEAHIGGIDILVNNAAIAHPRKFEQITEAEWDEVLAVNLKSVFLVTQAVIGGMLQRKWGRIINLSSVAAQTGGAVGAHYAASKAGIIGLTHSCASAFIREGITVNAIAPALIETDMVASNPNANPSLIPMGHFGSVDDVASVAVMLATNGYLTGQTISVNGGWYMS